MLSRPESLGSLLCHGLPDRAVLEGGPPEELSGPISQLLDSKIEATKQAIAEARELLGWPPKL